MLNFFQSYSPDPMAFAIGSFAVHWYGLLLLVGFTVGYFLVKRLSRWRGFEPSKITSIYANLIIWGLVGARFYHVLNEPGFYFNNLGQILAIWNGGLAIHGAIIAGLLVLYYYHRRGKFNFWALSDLYVIPLILGQAIGRWGNYFNQELFGQPTDSALGIPIAIANRPAGYEQFTHFQPTFLYESVWNFLIFVFLLIIYKKNSTSPSQSPVEPRSGVALSKGFLFWLYIGLYSLGRAGTELLRIDDVPLIWEARLPLLVSIILLVLAGMMLYKERHNNNFEKLI